MRVHQVTHEGFPPVERQRDAEKLVFGYRTLIQFPSSRAGSFVVAVELRRARFCPNASEVDVDGFGASSPSSRLP